MADFLSSNAPFVPKDEVEAEKDRATTERTQIIKSLGDVYKTGGGDSAGTTSFGGDSNPFSSGSGAFGATAESGGGQKYDPYAAFDDLLKSTKPFGGVTKQATDALSGQFANPTKAFDLGANVAREDLGREIAGAKQSAEEELYKTYGANASQMMPALRTLDQQAIQERRIMGGRLAAGRAEAEQNVLQSAIGQAQGFAGLDTSAQIAGAQGIAGLTEGAANRATAERGQDLGFLSSERDRGLVERGQNIGMDQFASEMDWTKYATEQGWDRDDAKMAWQSNEAEKDRVSNEKLTQLQIAGNKDIAELNNVAAFDRMKFEASENKEAAALQMGYKVGPNGELQGIYDVPVYDDNGNFVATRKGGLAEYGAAVDRQNTVYLSKAEDSRLDKSLAQKSDSELLNLGYERGLDGELQGLYSVDITDAEGNVIDTVDVGANEYAVMSNQELQKLQNRAQAAENSLDRAAQADNVNAQIASNDANALQSLGFTRDENGNLTGLYTVQDENGQERQVGLAEYNAAKDLERLNRDIASREVLQDAALLASDRQLAASQGLEIDADGNFVGKTILEKQLFGYEGEDGSMIPGEMDINAEALKSSKVQNALNIASIGLEMTDGSPEAVAPFMDMLGKAIASSDPEFDADAWKMSGILSRSADKDSFVAAATSEGMDPAAAGEVWDKATSEGKTGSNDAISITATKDDIATLPKGTREYLNRVGAGPAKLGSADFGRQFDTLSSMKNELDITGLDGVKTGNVPLESINSMGTLALIYKDGVDRRTAYELASLTLGQDAVNAGIKTLTGQEPSAWLEGK